MRVLYYTYYEHVPIMRVHHYFKSLQTNISVTNLPTHLGVSRFIHTSSPARPSSFIGDVPRIQKIHVVIPHCIRTDNTAKQSAIFYKFSLLMWMHLVGVGTIEGRYRAF